MAKRGLSGLAQGFNEGYDTVGRVIKDYEIGKIANAKEETQNGYSAEDGAQLEAIANAKDENGNPYYTVGTDENGKYTVTPVNAPAAAGGINPPERFSDTAASTMATKDRTTFLGKTYDAPLTDTQRDSARTMAMAGVYDKQGDPEKAFALRTQARQLDQAEKQGKLTDLQIAQGERAGRREDKADANTAQLEEIDKDVSDWTAKRLTGPDGAQRPMTNDDHLEVGQYRAAKLVGAGRVQEASALAKDNMSMAANKIQLQTAERNEAIAVTGAAIAAGDLSKLGPFYDKFVPDGAKVSNVTQDPKTGKISIERETADGRKIPAVEFKDKNELLAGLSTFKDPMALYNFSQNEFNRLLHIRSDARAGAAESRAAENYKQGKDDRIAAQNAGVALYAETNKDATPVQLAAVKAGVLPAVPSLNSNAPAEVKLAQAMVNAGMAPDMRTALEVAITKKGQSGDSLHSDFVQAGIKNLTPAVDAVAKADEAMAAMGYSKKNGRWGVGESSAATVAKFGTAAEADAAAKAGKLKAGDKVEINGRTATYKP